AMYGAGAAGEPSSSNRILRDRRPHEPRMLMFGRFDNPMSPTMLTPGTVFKTSSVRSEEHTSELQSRENLVCRLLLEKKNGVLLSCCVFFLNMLGCPFSWSIASTPRTTLHIPNQSADRPGPIMFHSCIVCTSITMCRL